MIDESMLLKVVVGVLIDVCSLPESQRCLDLKISRDLRGPQLVLYTIGMQLIIIDKRTVPAKFARS